MADNSLSNSFHSDSSKSAERLTETEKTFMQDKQTKAYVPIALILATEIENHDIFREILTEMFESIRNPKS